MEERKRPRMRSRMTSALVAAVTAGLVVATGAYSDWRWGGRDGSISKAAPDLVLYNGKVSTVDRHGSTVEAVAIRRGKIFATGRSGPTTTRW